MASGQLAPMAQDSEIFPPATLICDVWEALPACDFNTKTLGDASSFS